MDRGGKKFAIVLSALMLGYAALEYSIFWSMVLHFINNDVFAVGFALLVEKLFPDVTVTGASLARYGVEGFFAVIGIILIVREDGIAHLNAYMAENAPEKGTWKKTFINPVFIIALIAVTALSIFMIGPV